MPTVFPPVLQLPLLRRLLPETRLHLPLHRLLTERRLQVSSSAVLQRVAQIRMKWRSAVLVAKLRQHTTTLTKTFREQLLSLFFQKGVSSLFSLSRSLCRYQRFRSIRQQAQKRRSLSPSSAHSKTALLSSAQLSRICTMTADLITNGNF